MLSGALKVAGGRRLHRTNRSRRARGRPSVFPSALLLLLLLTASAPHSHANVVASTASIGDGEFRDAIRSTRGADFGSRGAVVIERPGVLPSRVRALLASLDAQTPVPAAAKPRRAVSEAKAKPAAGNGDAPAASGDQASAPSRTARSAEPPEIVDGSRAGQAGYVHFFLLDTPEGDDDIQVGIELADGRIAWSFPDMGASVVPFIRSGSIEVAGRSYGVRHLYGLRPFPDAESMAALRAALWERVSPLVEGETPYCNPFLRSRSLCLSCLGFVQEALFPGRTPGSPAMPADFPRTRSRLYYTTDDLLLYLTGFHEIATAEARARRIEELTLPSYLKEDLWQIVEAFDLRDTAGGIDTSKMKNAVDKRPAGRTYTRTPPQRKRL